MRSITKPNQVMASPRRTTKGEMAIFMVNRVIKFWNLDKKDARVKKLQALAQQGKKTASTARPKETSMEVGKGDAGRV